MKNVICLFFFIPWDSCLFTLAQSPLLNHCKVCLWAFCDQECMRVCEYPATAPPSVEVEDILMAGFTAAWSLRTYQCFLHFIIFTWTEITLRQREQRQLLKCMSGSQNRKVKPQQMCWTTLDTQARHQGFSVSVSVILNPRENALLALMPTKKGWGPHWYWTDSGFPSCL